MILSAGVILLGFCFGVGGEQARTLKRFKVPEYDDQGVKKSELTGENAVVQEDGTAEITGLKINLFDADGSVKMKVTAPLCKYRQRWKIAKSPSSVRVEASRMIVTGEDFAWDGNRELFKIFTNSMVVIRSGTAPLEGMMKNTAPEGGATSKSASTGESNEE